MIKKVLNNNGKKVIAVALGFALIISAIIITINGTLAAPADIVVNLPKPNGYTEIGKGATASINVPGLIACRSGDLSIATVNLASAGKMEVTGVKAGVAAIGINSAVYTAVVYYQISDSSNISSYRIKDNGEVLLGKVGNSKPIPVTVTEGTNNIAWISTKPSVATVSGGAITGMKKGVALIIGNFTDKWGVERDIHILVGVETSLNDGDDIIEGEDGNRYRPVGKPPNVYERVDQDGKSKQPPEYVYNPGTPGDGNDRPAYPDGNGDYWVEDPTDSNIWKKVENDGRLSEDNVVWGGEDGKFGGGDDKPVKKFGNNWWVHMGQNVWKQVTGRYTLGALTGGGPNKNPAVAQVVRIHDNTKVDGRYYVGVLGPDSDGDYYYYGDPLTNGNGTLDSTESSLELDDVRYYRKSDGTMTTENPKQIVTVNVSPDYVVVPKNGTQTFTAQAVRRDGTIVPPSENDGKVTWTLVTATSDSFINPITGVLTVGAGEEKGALSIKATSQKAPSVVGMATVSVRGDQNAIRNVAITPDSATVQKGNTQPFSAKVFKNNNTEDGGGVTWKVEPALSGTSIDSNGLLKVGAKETASILIVTATSKTDPNAYSTAIVTVTDKPINDVPEIADDGNGNGGRVLTTDKTGDIVNWVEIARNGKYSLIVRSKYINWVGGCYDELGFIYTTYGSTSAYGSSNVRNYINRWFNGTVSGHADKLSVTARLRSFTMQNNATSVLGTSSSQAALTNGFSKPTNIKIPSGSDDVAFALSFGEMANFISKTADVRGVGSVQSSAAAKANFNKITIPQVHSYSMWSRSPGDLTGTAGDVNYSGRAFQSHLSTHMNGQEYKEYGCVYPALWVDQAIFDAD